MNDYEKRQRINELKELIYQKKKEKDYAKAMQLALKLTLNGTYGAFANQHFVCSNADIANAITAHGRDVIQFMMNHIEEYFYFKWHLNADIHQLIGKEYIGMINGKYAAFTVDFKVLGWEHAELSELLRHKNISIDDLVENKFTHNDITILYDYVLHEFNEVKCIDENPKFEPYEGRQKYIGSAPVTIYGDTDSIFHNSLIMTDNGELTVEDFYNRNIKNGSAGDTLKGHESVKTSEKVLNYDTNKELYYAPVKRIIRHKVTKEKWLLRTKSGKEIFVTNDHSMIVFRDGKQLEVKPRDVLKTDKILIVKR